MQLQKAQKLAYELIAKHNLEYNFRFDSSLRRFGSCNISKKIITLSRKLVKLNDEKRVIKTLVHEIAHALTPNSGHNWKWRKVAKSLGHSGERCYSLADTITVKPKLIGTCPVCKRTTEAFRKRGVACGICCRLHNGGKFTTDFLLQWSSNKGIKN